MNILMTIILLIFAIVILLILFRKENFKSMNSDFIEETGQTKYDTDKLNELVEKFKKQITDIPQTNKHVPNSRGRTTSLGWDPLFIPEGKTKEEVLDNLGNLDKKSFLKILGWEQYYEPTTGEEEILKNHLLQLFPNVIVENEVVIQKLVKHEDNFFSLIFYLGDNEFNMYYARVNGLFQVQNGTTIVQKLVFEGLVTPFSVMSLKTADHDEYVQKGYDERERREQVFLTKDDIRQKLKDFDKNRLEILTRGHAHAAKRPVQLE